MTLYRDDMVEKVAEECGQSKQTVKEIIKAYTEYIYDQTKTGYTVKFLRLFYLDNKKEKSPYTFGYVCDLIGKEKGYKASIVQAILETYEACILEELNINSTISIYGIAKLYKVPELRIRKSGRLANTGYRVRSTKWFRTTVQKGNEYDRSDT